MKLPILQIAKYSFFIYIVFFFNLSFGQNYKDSLLIKLKTSKNDTVKIKQLLNLGDYYYFAVPDSSLIYYKSALELSNKIKNKKFQAESLLNIGYYLDDNEKHKESLEYYLKAIELYKAVNDEHGVANCYNYIGYSFSYLNSLDNSIKYYFKALDIYKKIGDSLGIADIYNGFGNLYYDKENYGKAENYYLKSFNIYNALNNKEGLLASNINLGNSISDQGNLDVGIEYYNKSITLCKELNDLDGISINYANIGECYIDKGEYDLALNFLMKSLKLAKEIDYKSLLPLIYSNIAKAKLKQKKYHEVVENANISLEYSKAATWVNIEYDAHSYLSSAYAEIGNYKKAYENHILYKKFKDSIFNVKGIEQLNKIDVLTELDYREKEIESLNRNKEVREIQLKNQKKLSYVLGISSLFFIFLIIILNKQRKRRLKVNQLLEIEKDKAQESDRLKSAFLANMSHEIRTPMSAILGFSSLLKDDDLKTEKRNHFIEVINKSGKRLMTIINDIIDISRIESKQLKVDLENVDVSNILKDIIEVQKETNNLLTKNKIDLKLKLPTTSHTIFIKTDENRFTQIFNNLINNASKFTKKGSIEIGFELKQNNENSHIQFYVKDTGSGIPANMFEEIFNRFSQVGEKDFKSGNGLGLSICKGIITKLGGDIWLESTEGVGTTFYFTLPY